MLITVTTLTGKSILVEIDVHDSLFRLKERIRDKEGIPPWNMKLIFSGKELEDDRTLHDYNIQKGSEIHLVPTGCFGGSCKITISLEDGKSFDVSDVSLNLGVVSLWEAIEKKKGYKRDSFELISGKTKEIIRRDRGLRDELSESYDRQNSKYVVDLIARK